MNDVETTGVSNNKNTCDMQVNEVPDQKKWHLRSLYGSSSVYLKLKAGGSTESKEDKATLKEREEKIDQLHTKIDKIWEKASAHISSKDSNFKDLKINFSQQSIFYKTANGKLDYIAHYDLEEGNELETLMQEVRDLSHDLLSFIDPENPSSKTIGERTGKNSFEMNYLQGTLKKDPQRFFTEGHFDRLFPIGTDELVRIKAKTAIDETIHLIDALKKKADKELKKLNAGTHTVDLNKSKYRQEQDRKSDIENLEKYIAMLEDVNYYALFTAIGVFGSNESPKDDHDHIALAEKAREKTYQTLQNIAQPKQTWLEYVYDPADRKNLQSRFPNLASDAHEVGSLLLPTHEAYALDQEETPSPAKTPSMTGFIARLSMTKIRLLANTNYSKLKEEIKTKDSEIKKLKKEILDLKRSAYRQNKATFPS